MATKQFSKGFYWGTATASFQIEGATEEDGRGESIWDRFAATPGKILTGEMGDPACDSYHLYQKDIEVMQGLGVNAYRFSIAWPRVIPDGAGAVNRPGLDYYDRVVDALFEAEITPFITLYHWDLPQALQNQGGWANRTTIEAYVRYVDVVVSRLGDRVKFWMTHNEPWCVAFLGHLTGEHAPGLEDRKIALQVAHNVLLSHGAAVPIIRERCPNAKVGIALNFTPAYPATDSQADQIATLLFHQKFNHWFLDPIMGCGYPQEAWQDYGDDVPEVLADDMGKMAPPLDFLGVNYYTRRVCHDPSGGEGNRVLHQRDDDNVTDRNWEIYPEGLYDLLTWLHKNYDFDTIYIMENGASYDDEISHDGRVHDPERIDFVKQHLGVLLRAIEDGVPVMGYFYWTLTDNFEWTFGTSSRFGLAYTNFETQERVLKDGGNWYGRITRANALVE